MRKIWLFTALLTCLVIGVGSASATASDDSATASPAMLTPHTFTIELLPSGDPDGSGTAVLTVNLMQGTVCYDITVTGIGEPTGPAAGIGNAHIHSYAKGGAIAVDLETQFTLVATDTYRATGCVTASRQVLVDILLHPELYYVNVHTVEDPGGAVQGDLASVAS